MQRHSQTSLLSPADPPEPEHGKEAQMAVVVALKSSHARELTVRLSRQSVAVQSCVRGGEEWNGGDWNLSIQTLSCEFLRE